MNIILIIVLAYGVTFGLQNTLDRLTGMIHGVSFNQAMLGQILDGLFYVGIILLCMKHEEVTLWGLL